MQSAIRMTWIITIYKKCTEWSKLQHSVISNRIKINKMQTAAPAAMMPDEYFFLESDDDWMKAVKSECQQMEWNWTEYTKNRIQWILFSQSNENCLAQMGHIRFSCLSFFLQKQIWQRIWFNVKKIQSCFDRFNLLVVVVKSFSMDLLFQCWKLAFGKLWSWSAVIKKYRFTECYDSDGR